jgi:hypothetical protein
LRFSIVRAMIHWLSGSLHLRQGHRNSLSCMFVMDLCPSQAIQGMMEC